MIRDKVRREQSSIGQIETKDHWKYINIIEKGIIKLTHNFVLNVQEVLSIFMRLL